MTTSPLKRLNELLLAAGQMPVGTATFAQLVTPHRGKIELGVGTIKADGEARMPVQAPIINNELLETSQGTHVFFGRN